MQIAHGAPALPGGGFGARHRAHPRLNSRWHRNVDGDFALELAIRVEHLDAAVAAIAYVDVALGVRRDGVGQIEFSRLIVPVAPLLGPTGRACRIWLLAS